MNPLRRATYAEHSPESIAALKADAKRIVPTATDEYIENLLKDERQSEVWMNETYQVSVKRQAEMTWLSIKRRDREPCRDWRDFQEIKNQLVGPECEGVELYPAESRLVDTANEYHLFVVNNPSYRFPFGFTHRTVDDQPHPDTKVKQRPFKKEK